MNILFLTDNFPPEVNAPASRTYEHAREWVKAGHTVTVVTCAPNFPAGALFDGYKNRLFARESVDGIAVVRVWSYITANEGTLKRTLDYASFMASAILASPFAGKVDVVVATSPQFFCAVAGRIVAAARRKPFVFELRDIWPESIKAVGAMKDGRILRAFEWLEMHLYRRAEAIVSVTRSFRERLIERGIEGDKVHVVTNGADLTRYSPAPKDADVLARHGLEGRFVAGYVGTHGMAHALGTLLEAAEILAAEGADDVSILLLGGGAEKANLKARAAEMGLTNVVFVDTVPKSEVARYWSILDASIIHLRRTDLFKTVIPSKMFECMAMGIPVLHGVEGESAQILHESGAGLTFQPENARALADMILRLKCDPDLARRLGEAGIAGARAYDRTRLAGRMLAILEDVAAAKTRNPSPSRTSR